MMKTEYTERVAFHKADFTYRNRVGRCLGAAVTNNMNLRTGGSKPPPYDKRSTDSFVRTPFHTPCPARYSVLHLLDVLSGGNEPSPVGEGGPR